MQDAVYLNEKMWSDACAHLSPEERLKVLRRIARTQGCDPERINGWDPVGGMWKAKLQSSPEKQRIGWDPEGGCE